MPEASLSDRLLRLANRLEQWLEQSTARRELPLRAGGYALLVGLMVGSNLAARYAGRSPPPATRGVGPSGLFWPTRQRTSRWRSRRTNWTPSCSGAASS
jgi:hypothetical protein